MSNKRGGLSADQSQGDDQAVVNPELEKGRVKEYIVPDGEEGSIHAEIEQVQFNTGTGKKISSPTVQKFDPRAWNNFRMAARSLGYTYIKVLHAPKGTPTDIVELRT